MSSKSKSLALMLVIIGLTAPLLLPYVKGESSNSAPAIEWQKEYGNAATHDNRTEAVSNLIQTNDGGYIFLDLGWDHSVTLQPATLYKTNHLGELQWQRPINNFLGKSIIQTSDGGYELSGYWSNYPGSESVSTVIKISEKGDRQWVENYSTPVTPTLANTSTCLQTSDGGFAYIKTGTLVKADSSNHTEWTIELTLDSKLGFGKYIPVVFSLTETSDGAIAILGVDNEFYNTNVWGSIYLAKTEPFLPVPSQTPLPTPLPTPIIVGDSVIPLAIVIGFVVVLLTVSIFVRQYRKKAKSNNFTPEKFYQRNNVM
jgi:hypothetical protein